MWKINKNYYTHSFVKDDNKICKSPKRPIPGGETLFSYNPFPVVPSSRNFAHSFVSDDNKTWKSQNFGGPMGLGKNPYRKYLLT